MSTNVSTSGKSVTFDKYIIMLLEMATAHDKSNATKTRSKRYVLTADMFYADDPDIAGDTFDMDNASDSNDRFDWQTNNVSTSDAHLLLFCNSVSESNRRSVILSLLSISAFNAPIGALIWPMATLTMVGPVTTLATPERMMILLIPMTTDSLTTVTTFDKDVSHNTYVEATAHGIFHDLYGTDVNDNSTPHDIIVTETDDLDEANQLNNGEPVSVNRKDAIRALKLPRSNKLATSGFITFSDMLALLPMGTCLSALRFQQRNESEAPNFGYAGAPTTNGGHLDDDVPERRLMVVTWETTLGALLLLAPTFGQMPLTGTNLSSRIHDIDPHFPPSVVYSKEIFNEHQPNAGSTPSTYNDDTTPSTISAPENLIGRTFLTGTNDAMDWTAAAEREPGWSSRAEERPLRLLSFHPNRCSRLAGAQFHRAV